jgi:hypothetical protein
MYDVREPKTVTNAALDALPLFADDKEIAVAIVGKAKASYWLTAVLPSLERSGFPAEDPLHMGRAVPLVRKFYEDYFGITAGFAMMKPDGEEKVWLGRRIENRIDKEERLRIDGVEFVERDFSHETPERQVAIAEYRAKKAAEYGARRK